MIGYVSLFVLFLSATAIGQLVPTPTPTPRPGSRAANVSPVIADTASYDRMRSIEAMSERERAEHHPLLYGKTSIYRKPGKEEISSLAVAELLRAKYAGFLSTLNTGIVKLSAESACVTDADVLVASERCLNFQMPGGGAAYSFRTESYRLPRLADIILLNGTLKTGGVFQQVVFTEIGDVPIEDISLNTIGINYLVKMVTVRDSDEFMRYESEIVKGIASDGFIYRKGQLPKENTTYALRSIAYRGKYIRTVNGLEYNELDFDKRRDIIVAFRIIDKDAGGNLTIVWKSLKDVEAPKLKVKQ